MALPARIVLPEMLDDMQPQDPRAERSRRDLRRVHRVMRTISIILDALRRMQHVNAPRRILELGGGDATLALRLARALQPAWPNVSLTVLDNHDIVSAETRAGYHSLGWELTVIRQDALQWTSDPGPAHYDLCLANLFLHHFDNPALSRLLAAISSTCDALVACEPRRNSSSLLGSRMIGLLGVNQITRADAVTSVLAGFSGQEITALWPCGQRGWTCREYLALPFTHCFHAMNGAFTCAATT